MTQRRFRIIEADKSHTWVRETYTDMHRVCFPEADDQLPVGDLWFAWETDVDMPVAFASLWPSQRVDGAGYLARAGVLPAARGCGLQKRLIRVREKEAKLKGWHVMFSDVDPSNAQSMNNLFACGYRAFVPSDPWQGRPWVYVKKIIDTGVG